MAYCENCGSKVYNNGCINCNEEEYIIDQYIEDGLKIPESLLTPNKAE